MALSIESIYKPVSDYFLSRFKTDDGSPVVFKFDKFGSIISDEDFSDPTQPNHAALAQQKFSDFVNRLPAEEQDGINITFPDRSVDQAYYLRLLTASIPFAPETDPHKEDIITSFTRIKADAERVYERYKLARVGAGDGTAVIADTYIASEPNPSDWFVKENNDIWTEHRFQTTETITSPVDNTPKFQLWKLKVDDDVLKQILPAQEIEVAKPAALHHKILMMRTNPQLLFSTAALARTVEQPDRLAAIVRDHRTGFGTGRARVRDHRTAAVEHVTVRDHRGDVNPGRTFTMQESIRKAATKLDLRRRYEVDHFIKEKAPTQPVTTNSLSISFKYCLVNVRRPWISDAFIHNKSWFIPGVQKGQLSMIGIDGGISALPIGFVAIKDLNIEANWSDQDRQIAKEATDFGPFEVKSEIINNKLSYEGIQIIGWILQRMPALPPNDPPQ